MLQETGSSPTHSRLNYVPSGDTLRRDAISSYTNVNNPSARKILLQMMGTFNLTDAFRHLHDERRYTWCRKNPVRQARLDYFITSDIMLDLIHKCDIRPGYRSDHSIVELQLIFCKFERGKGIWKLNCSLLKQQEYLDIINRLIEHEKQFYSVPIYHYENCKIQYKKNRSGTGTVF